MWLLNHSQSGTDADMVMSVRSRTARSALCVLGVTALGFVIVTVLNIQVPLLLSPDQFGQWRTFVLITSFSGIFHIGFVDGMLLEWITEDELNPATLTQALLPFLTLQVLMGLLISALAVAVLDSTVLAVLVALQIVTNNVSALLQAYLQARRQYAFGTFVGFIPSLLMLGMLLLFGAFVNGQAIRVIEFFVLVTTAVVLTLGAYLVVPSRNGSTVFSSKSAAFWSTVRRGLPVLLANLAITGFFAVDKFVVRFLYGETVFGHYAFAATLVAIAFSMLVSVTNVILKYFVNASETAMARVYTWLVRAIIGIEIVALFAFPLFERAVKLFFLKYNDSLPYLLTLLGTLGSGLIVQLFQINVLKSRNLQHVFLRNTGIVVALASIVGVVMLQRASGATAVGVLISSAYFTWALLNENTMAQTITAFRKGYWQRVLLIAGGFVVYVGVMFWNKVSL
jgi:O-antigen/teichoic acid export membrane protein